MISKEKDEGSWYEQYIRDHYINKNSKRDNILSNKEVLFQYLEKNKSVKNHYCIWIDIQEYFK